MAILDHQRRNRFGLFALRSIVTSLILSLVFYQPISYAQLISVLGLPKPGTMVNLSPAYVPLMITGLTVHPENPLLMDFIVSTGNSGMTADQVKKESERLIKYFLACLTIPENDQWVNLSPYEKQRIVPEDLGQTVLGQDMLAQDYLLKQLTASLIYPEKNLGKNFWDKVYAKASQMYGTTQIPVNTFNKVWILPDTAKVYEHKDTVFVVKSHLKVMLDEDYLALSKHADINLYQQDVSSLNASAGNPDKQQINNLGSQIVRQIILPAIEQEVNTGKNFAQLRQIYNSMILAVWFKKNLKQALLNQVYTDKAKVNGVNADDPAIKEKIYKQYLQAYKKGVFNYIKEEADQNTKEIIPRKYFSGGLTAVDPAMLKSVTANEAATIFREDTPVENQFFKVSSAIGSSTENNGPSSATVNHAMTADEAKQLGFSSVVQENIKAGVIVSEKEHAVLQLLSQAGEQDLLNGWEAPGDNDQRKREMLEQIADISEFVAGGFDRYKKTAIDYFDILKNDRNPFEGAKAEVPEGIDLTDPLSTQFEHYSKVGMQNADKLGFVLVAGGMGERLGILGKKLLNSGGTKVEIQVNPVGDQTYIATYAANIIAMQDAYNKNKPANHQIKIPFFIMTSDETHEQTIRIFAQNHNFGFDGVSVDPTPEQIARGELMQVVISRQKSVPALKNSLAKFTTVPGDPYRLETKPHNHVDVHRLLAQTGVAKYWEAIGKSTFIFFQDTNAQAFNAIPAFAGVTIEKDLDGNILTVNRRPGDKVGCIVRMVKDGVAKTYNVEYNQIAGVLKSMGLTEADFVDQQGNSLFPGNTNVLAFKASTYNRILAHSGGSFSEMLNLKDPDLQALKAAKDGQVVDFGNHPRLEAMMQDMFKEPDMKNVAFTKFSNPVGFMATKNGFENALIAVAKGNMSESLPWAQGGYYRHERFLLAQAGVKIDVDGQQRFAFEGDYLIDIGGGKTKNVQGIPFQEGAYVSLPFMLPYQAKHVFLNGGSVSPRSFLIVNGSGDVVFDNLQLDGTLVVYAVKGVHLTIKGLSVKNQGWRRVFLTADQINDPKTPILEVMQGYHFMKSPDTKVINIVTPGHYEIDSDGQVKSLDEAMVAPMKFTNVKGNIKKWLGLAQKVSWGDINPDMFRDYDYRYVKDGVPLKPEIVFVQTLVWAKMALGKAEAQGIKTRDVLVARDARKIEPEIADAEIAALRYAGLNVVFVGDEPDCVTSYSWAVQSHEWLMTIFNTASHVSEPENVVVRGFKVTQLVTPGGNVLSLTTKEIKTRSLALLKEILTDKTGIKKMEAVKLGDLSRKSIEADAIRFNTAVGLVAANNGSLYQLGQDIKQKDPNAQVDAVINSQQNEPLPLVGLKVVVEGSHTSSGPLAAGVFRNLGAVVEGLNLDVQEISGVHDADPSIDKNLKALKKKIIETHANFGIAFDLDGDRGAILIPEWNPDGTIKLNDKGGEVFHMLAPDNLLGVLMPSLLKDWGYSNLVNKKVGVIRDVLGTYGVNDAAKQNGIEMFQTDAGYVYLKALKEHMEAQGYVFPIYGERSGHTWLNVSGEIENPIAVAVLFSTIVAKQKDHSDINGVLNLYKELAVPYSQSPRFQPFYHPRLLQWLSDHNDLGWKYVPGVNPPQAIVALGKDETVKRLSLKFPRGAEFGEYKVSAFNTYKDPVDEGGLYRFADIMFEKHGQFAGRVVVRASSNEPTFVMSYESPILEGKVQEADRNRVMTSGLVMQFMADEGLGIFTRDQMSKLMDYLPPAKQEIVFNKANLSPIEEDLETYSHLATKAKDITPSTVLIHEDDETIGLTGNDGAMTATEAEDKAVLVKPGGIDLNSRTLNMESSGQKVDITFDPAMIAQFRRGDFSGVKIQILNVVPVNLMPLLGLKEDEETGQLAKA